MIVIPAIDIKDGQVVRLYKGDYDKVTKYNISPLEAALSFKKNGAQMLHIIDLDGAKSGKMANFDVIAGIIKKTNMPCQVGGGIRTENTVRNLLNIGVNWVIIGTAALLKPDFLSEMIKKYKNKITIALDVLDEKPMIKGWKDEVAINFIQAAKSLEALGAERLIYTDIAKDGTMEGPNYRKISRLIESVNVPTIVSGGIKNKRQITKIGKLGAQGVIVGKSFYEGKIKIKEVNDAD